MSFAGLLHNCVIIYRARAFTTHFVSPDTPLPRPHTGLGRRNSLPNNLLGLGFQHGTPIILNLDVRRINLVPLFILERSESPETPTVEHRLVLVPTGTRGGEHLFAGKDGVLQGAGTIRITGRKLQTLTRVDSRHPP
jgi:hypothetical protein